MLEWLETLSLARWVLPVALAGGGILLGLLAETILLRRLRRFVERTPWQWDDLILSSIRGMAFVWFTAAGLYATLLAVALPDAFRSVLEDVLMILVILSLAVVAARGAAGAIRLWARRTTGGIPSTSLLQNVARGLVFLLGVFLIIENLGLDITALLTGLGIGGLAVALALQDTLSNLFAGFQIILARQVRNGDFVRLDTGEEGFVTDIKWRNTTIKSRIEDHEVIVPNAKLSNAIVTNYSLPATPYWVRLEIGVSYDSDLEKVEEVTLEVARRALEELEVGEGAAPVLRYRAFGDSSIQFVVRVRVGTYAEQFAVRHTLVKRIHSRYREEGIEIPFPIRTLYAPRGFELRDGEEREPAVERAPAPARAGERSSRGGRGEEGDVEDEVERG